MKTFSILFSILLMATGLATTTLTLTSVAALAAPVQSKTKTKQTALATDSEHCQIYYFDESGARSLKRKCPKQKSATSYFAMDDTSAPLLEGRAFKVGSDTYLATRWGTGKSEEVILFDLAAPSAKIADRVISDGPSSVTLDKTKKKIKLEMTEQIQKDDTVTASTKTLYWPSHL